MEYIYDSLWQRIEKYSFDAPGAAHPFSVKLAKQQGWTFAFTQQAVAEYKRFMYLCCVLPNGASPSPIVDEVWHLHLTYTIDYWKRFCGEVLGKEVHHHPSQGGGIEGDKHKKWYADTLEQYERVFGTKPPEDIWPWADEQGTIQAEIPVTENFFECGPKWRYLLLLLPFAVAAIWYEQANPFKLLGKHFLTFYMLLGLAAVAVVLVSRYAARDKLFAIMRSVPVNRYQAAYLAGGEVRVALLQTVELVKEGSIEQRGADRYSINQANLNESKSPLKYVLQEDEQREPYFKGLFDLAKERAVTMDPRLRYLRASYNKVTNVALVPSLVVLVGIARLIQGVSNHKPVWLLIFLLVVFVVAVIIAIRTTSFHASGVKLIRDNSLPVAVDPFTVGIILGGLAAVSAMPLYASVRDYDGGGSWTSSGDSGGCGSDSSCSSGGGCSSGCGGCGGD